MADKAAIPPPGKVRGNLVTGTGNDCHGTGRYGWGDLNLLDEGKPGWLPVPFDTHL